MGVDFQVVVPAVDERRDGDPACRVVENALRKARAGAGLAPSGSVVLGVDTDVALAGRLLGKPSDAAGARERIEALAGRTHEVLSGIVLISDLGERSELVRTAVTFRSLRAGEIASYVASREWEGRAGGYAVQGLGSGLVERIDGDLSNVIGLPIPALSRMIGDLQDR